MMLYLAFLPLLISSSSSLVCLNCPDIAHPRFCEHVEECGQGEICGIERRVDEFQTVSYKLGCKFNETCRTANPLTRATTCEQCCTSDLCNSHGCGESDDKLSDVHVCYQCDGNLPTERCQKIGFCKQNELCFTKEEFRGAEKYMQFGCMEKQVCEAVTGFQPGFGKRVAKRADPIVRCCTGNLCNYLTISNSTKPTTTHQTTTFTQSPTNTNCNSTKIESPINCQFENNNMCNYTQDHLDDFDWISHSGMTSSINTGPSADHTFQTAKGHYMYIEASIIEKNGDTARLWTPTITPVEGQCLSFWYNMYGLTIGKLNIYSADVEDTSTLMSSIIGDQGQSWHQKCIPLSSSEPLKLVFEGVGGNSYTGDIAIDDIQLNMGCPCACLAPETPVTMTHLMFETTAPITNKVTTQTHTDTTLEVQPTTTATDVISTTEATQQPVSTEATRITSLINCDFETSDICNYIQEKNETHDWIRQMGGTTSLNTGPTADHTYNTQNGHYMYLETSNSLSKGEKARLWTPEITLAPGQCLSFWYNMHGRTVGSLRLLTGSNNVIQNSICEISGNQGSEWHQSCYLVNATTSLQFGFEAITGDGYTGDIAIDDVQLNSKCPCTNMDNCS